MTAFPQRRTGAARQIAASFLTLITTLIVAGTVRGEHAAPAPALPPIPAGEDACFMAVKAAAVDAERTCSDRLAALRYDGAADPAQRLALAGTLNNRAMARMAAGDLEGAGADFEEAVGLEPEAWAIYLNRGNYSLMRADPAAALEDYGRVAELAPAASEAARAARRNSALAWRALGNLAAAEQSLSD